MRVNYECSEFDTLDSCREAVVLFVVFNAFRVASESVWVLEFSAEVFWELVAVSSNEFIELLA